MIYLFIRCRNLELSCTVLLDSSTKESVRPYLPSFRKKILEKTNGELVFLFLSTIDCICFSIFGTIFASLREAGLVQLWKRLPPTNVARIWFRPGARFSKDRPVTWRARNHILKSVSRKVGCILTSNEIHFVCLVDFVCLADNSYLEWKTKRLNRPGNYRELRETGPRYIGVLSLLLVLVSRKPNITEFQFDQEEPEKNLLILMWLPLHCKLSTK